MAVGVDTGRGWEWEALTAPCTTAIDADTDHESMDLVLAFWMEQMSVEESVVLPFWALVQEGEV